jgi:polar amino acid transport system substrate-binding protein
MTLPTIMEEPWGLAVKLEERDGAWGQVHGGGAREWHRNGKLIELEKKWGIQASAFLKTMQEKYSEKGS